jgi:hypothetical protein
MARYLLLAMAALVSGCAHSPYKAPTPGKPIAVLVLRQDSETLAPNRQGGIFAVDGHPVAKEDHFSVDVTPGHHVLAFLCPGWMYVDGFPTMAHDFRSGQHYELHCENSGVYISP